MPGVTLVCRQCGQSYTFDDDDPQRVRLCPADQSMLEPVERLSSEITIVTGPLGKPRAPREEQPEGIPLKLPVRWGKYRIESVIARGGMGVVYRGFQEGIERPVAIKMLLPEVREDERFIGRLKREVRAMGKLQHPGIVAVHGYGEYHGAPFFTMDLVEGQPLDRYLQLGVVTTVEKLELIRDACLAIDHAHAHGILHRDLKPSNIMVTPERQVKLLDFGLAKDTGRESLLSIEGQIVGTPAFMSPEQAEGLEVGPATDVYSLGAMLYAALTGHEPFEGQTALQTVYQVVHGEPKDPRELYPELDLDLVAIITKAMAREPEQRYASARAMAKDISRHLTGEPITARSPSRVDKLKRKLARNKLAVAVCGGTIAVALLVVAILWATAPDEIDAMQQALEGEGTRQASLASLLAGFHTDKFDDQQRARLVPLIVAACEPKASLEVKTALVDYLQRHIDRPVVRQQLAPKLVPHLVVYLEQGPKALQLALLRVLPHIKQPRPFDKAVVALLHSADPDLRCAAVKYCGQVPVALAFKRLNELFWDPHCGKEAAAATAHIYDSGLMRIFRVGSAGLGQKLAQVQDLVAKHNAKMQAMLDGKGGDGKSDGQPRTDHEVVLAKLRDPDVGQRIKACYELGRKRERRAVEPLLAALADPQIAGQAAFALVQIGDRRVAGRLIALLGHAQPETRRAAARALGRLGDSSARAALKAAHAQERDPRAREALLEAREALLEQK